MLTPPKLSADPPELEITSEDIHRIRGEEGEVPVTVSGLTNDDADLAAVTRLLSDYARFVDDRDADAWADLFGVDGALVVGDREIAGKSSLAEFGRRSPRGVHMQGLPSLARRADGGLDAISSFVFLNGTSGEILAGTYTDHLTYTDHCLQFRLRHISIRVRLEASTGLSH